MPSYLSKAVSAQPYFNLANSFYPKAVTVQVRCPFLSVCVLSVREKTKSLVLLEPCCACWATERQLSEQGRATERHLSDQWRATERQLSDQGRAASGYILWELTASMAKQNIFLKLIVLTFLTQQGWMQLLYHRLAVFLFSFLLNTPFNCVSIQ